jgi:hypothetical protein
MPAEEEQQDEIRVVIQTMREIRNAIILVGLATGENSVLVGLATGENSVARSQAKSSLEVWAREQNLLKP